MPYPSTMPVTTNTIIILPAMRKGIVLLSAQRCFVCLFLFLLISQLAATQPAQDTSDKFKNKIGAMVDKNAKKLLGEVTDNKDLFYQVFNPCIGSKPGKENFSKSKANFYSLLIDQVKTEVHNRYIASAAAAFEYFGNRTEEQVTKYINNRVTSGKVNKNILNELTKICADPKPPEPTHVNSPPVAKVVSPVVVRLPTDMAILDGSNSYDSDQDKGTLYYFWQRLAAPPGSDDMLLSKNSAVATASALKEGTYLYRFSVRDKYEAFDTATVIVIVEEQLLPPAASAGNDTTITLPSNTVLLKGRGKDRNKNGGIIAFHWSYSDGPPHFNILTENNAVTEVTGLKQGIYTFRLTVTNKAGLKGYDDVQVTVLKRPNHNPVVNAGTDQPYTLPISSISLRGEATDQDGDSLILTWRPPAGNNAIHIDNPHQKSTTVSNLTEGQYPFILMADDQNGGRGYDTVIITINLPDITKIPPVAYAGVDDTIKGKRPFILMGSGTDSDGAIVSYKWERLDGPVDHHFANADSAQTAVDKLQPGRYIFKLTVTDNDGLTASDSMILQVQTKSPFPPLWIWIFLIIILLAAGSYSYWFFFIWWNRKEKLIVYFLNKDEEELAHHFMPGHKRTQGYIVGHATRGNIRRMKKKKLVLKLLNTRNLVVQTPGVTSVYQYSLIKGEFKLKSQVRERPGYDYVNILPDNDAIRSIKNELPAYYIITLDAPLLPEFEEQLKAIGVDVIQRIPKDSYVVHIKEQWQLDKLENKEVYGFIRATRQYTAEDTGFTVRKEEYLRAMTPSENKSLILDLVVHREDERRLVETFLADHQVEIISMVSNTIRIRLQPGALSPEALASNKYIQAIYQHLPLVLYNDIAREMIGIEESDTHRLQFAETGQGEIIAVADTGIDVSHPDLSNAITDGTKPVSWGRTATNDTSDSSGHGTHVTGTIAGNGTASNGAIKGMAPGAVIFFQSLLADDNGTLCDIGMQMQALLKQAYDKGARIINISWGANTEAYYTFNEARIDEFVYNNQDMLVVISAGNTGASKKDISGRALPGFKTVGSPASTKNGLTVGASLSKRWDGDSKSIAPFSSKGPCRNDLRIKPDIVAPGTNILSLVSSKADLNIYDQFYDAEKRYAYLRGTSMATPVVSGAAALVREYYKKKRNCLKPSAALIKATLLNGTGELTGANAMQGSTIVPNNNQGFGILNLLASIPNDVSAFKLWFCDSFNEPTLTFRKTREAKMFRLQLKEKTWFRVCMVFVDRPLVGGMQSDIDLIISEERTGKKWIGNAGVGATISPLLADEEKDDRNNIEIVREYNAEPGDYIIEAVATFVPEDGESAMAMVITTGDTNSVISPTQL